MIYAVSQFKNELDVLEIRLATIAHLVDRIVLAEATVDQRGNPRELVYPKHADRFAQWADKITYVAVTDMPQGTTHEDDVARERFQRDALVRGMPDLKPDDIVFVSDLDEIPYPVSLRMAIREQAGLRGRRVRLPMDMHCMALNWRWRDRGCRIGSIACVVFGEDILEKGVCHAALWDSRVEALPGVHGYHLTYQGGPEYIRSKIMGMMDKVEALMMPGLDPALATDPAWIEECIRTGRDMFGRTYRVSDWVGLEELPPHVQENPERFAHMMVPRPVNQDSVEATPRCDCGGSGFDKQEVNVLGHLDPVQVVHTVMHFPYCELTSLPHTVVHGEDRRHVPRSKDV